MARYKSHFERINYGFSPPLIQSADVVFDTDIPNTNDHIEDFEEAAWDAVWKQNPHWADPKAPVEDCAGWSSVIGGTRYELIQK